MCIPRERILCTNVVLTAFSGYILALAKNSYEKRDRKMLMKLTIGKEKYCWLLSSIFIGKNDSIKQQPSECTVRFESSEYLPKWCSANF